MSELETAIKAIQLFTEMRPRPSQVTQSQAAEMLGLSRQTVSKMVRVGTLKLNKCGLIPTAEIDRVLQMTA